MTTTQSVELTLDTTAGVGLFLEHVQDVVFAATEYEAQALELAMQDPTHMSSVDILSNELHILYTTMRTEAAAAVSRGGLQNDEADKLQRQYNQLVTLRDKLQESATPIVSQPEQLPDTPSTGRTLPPLQRTRKTLQLDNQSANGRIPIKVSDSAKQRLQKNVPTKAPTPPVSKKQPTHTPVVVSPVQKPVRAAEDLPSPGVIKPAPDHSIAQLPFLSLVTDQALLEQIATHPRPKQLEYQIKAIIDSVESVQTDKFASWLGDGQTHTFLYLQSLPLQKVYELAALSILDLRAELAPHRVRPEAFLHWVQVLHDIQALYPGQSQASVGEVIVSAFALQVLSEL